jgi:hypothetical protein
MEKTYKNVTGNKRSAGRTEKEKKLYNRNVKRKHR